MGDDDEDRLDFMEIYERLEASTNLSERVTVLERRLKGLEMVERRLEIMQEVQNGLSIELDALRCDVAASRGVWGPLSNSNNNNTNSSNPSQHHQFANVVELRRLDAALRKEIRETRRDLYKKLMFCSDDDDEEDDDEDQERQRRGSASSSSTMTSTTRAEYRFGSDLTSKAVGAPLTTGAVPKRSKAGPDVALSRTIKASSSLGVDKSGQTVETEDSSTQADISEREIFRFVNSDLRARIGGIVEDTLRGKRFGETVHHFIDKSLQRMVDESFVDPASEKTIAKLLGVIRETLETFVERDLKETLADMVRDELRGIRDLVVVPTVSVTAAAANEEDEDGGCDDHQAAYFQGDDDALADGDADIVYFDAEEEEEEEDQDYDTQYPSLETASALSASSTSSSPPKKLSAKAEEFKPSCSVLLAASPTSPSPVVSVSVQSGNGSVVGIASGLVHSSPPPPVLLQPPPQLFVAAAMPWSTHPGPTFY